MHPIAVDAMGGDHAPAEILAGARAAVDEFGIPVVLVGRPGEIGDVGDIPVIPASEVIAMDDEPGNSVRTKKDSSLVRAAEAVRDGDASAMVSAGNTGATMASALLRMGRIRGVQRPAIATPIPCPAGPPTILLDAGANAECSAELLVQFALMGAVYARKRFEIDNPRVGLLSIGEEAGKGTPLVKEAHSLLETADLAAVGAKFLGNVEGRDLMTDGVDVVVTDGFTGNVTLKTLEGGLKALLGSLLDAFSATPEAARAAGALAPQLTELYTRYSPDTYGGAMLLGTRGVCIISHGSSRARAMTNAIRVAADMVERDVVGELASAIRPGTGD